MGLFDRLGGEREIALSPQAGLLLAAITMIGADGDIDDDEMAIVRRLDGSASTAAWEAAVKTYKMKSVNECIELATQSMDTEQRKVAMANLVDIAMADGTLIGAEKRLLETFVDAFGIDEGIVSDIVKVIAVKNNKAVFA